MSLLRRKESESGTEEQSSSDLKSRFLAQFLSEMKTWSNEQHDIARSQIEEKFNEFLPEAKLELSRQQRQRMFESIVAEVLGFGPLERLLADETITEIIVSGPKNIFVTRNGKRERSSVKFDDDDHLLQIINRLLHTEHIDQSNPLAKVRVGGAHITAIARPISLVGPVLAIYKDFHKPMTDQEFIDFGTLTVEMLEYLKSCVQSKLNILVFGDQSSGKTRLLNLLCSWIENDEMIVTVEEPAELGLRQELVITLELYSAYRAERISMNSVILHALHMRPDRLVVGELQLGKTAAIANAGDCPWLATIQAVHLEEVTPELAPAADVIIHMRRLRDNSRRVEQIYRVQGIQDGVFVLATWQEIR